MTDTFRIYTAGKMSGTSLQKQTEWRFEIERHIREAAERYGRSSDNSLVFIHPPLYYNYELKKHRTEREVKDWEVNQIRKSDIMIVNLDGINHSVGAHFELSVADSVNAFGGKHIYVIGVGKSEEPLHPWIQLSLHREEEDFEKAAEYIADYLLF